MTSFCIKNYTNKKIIQNSKAFEKKKKNDEKILTLASKFSFKTAKKSHSIFW